MGVRDFINKTRRGGLNTSRGQERSALQLLAKLGETGDLLFPPELRNICQLAPRDLLLQAGTEKLLSLFQSHECNDVNVASHGSLLCPTQCCCHPRVPSLCLYLLGLGQRSKAAVGWREVKFSSGSAAVAGACAWQSGFWGHLKQGFVVSSPLPCPAGWAGSPGPALRHSGVLPNGWEGSDMLMFSACWGSQRQRVPS